METRRTSSQSLLSPFEAWPFWTLAKTAGKTECHSSCSIMVSSSTLVGNIMFGNGTAQTPDQFTFFIVRDQSQYEQEWPKR
jgi:hypothetical protein